METLSILDNLLANWEILTAAFVIGGLYYEAKRSFKKIIDGIENTGRVHGQQNVILDSIHAKMDQLDKRMSKLEGSMEMTIIDNHEQSIKLAVIETRLDGFDTIKTPTPRTKRKVQ